MLFFSRKLKRYSFRTFAQCVLSGNSNFSRWTNTQTDKSIDVVFSRRVIVWIRDVKRNFAHGGRSSFDASSRDCYVCTQLNQRQNGERHNISKFASHDNVFWLLMRAVTVLLLAALSSRILRVPSANAADPNGPIIILVHACSYSVMTSALILARIAPSHMTLAWRTYNNIRLPACWLQERAANDFSIGVT